jgi:hypothetical protein
MLRRERRKAKPQPESALLKFSGDGLKEGSALARTSAVASYFQSFGPLAEDYAQGGFDPSKKKF